MIDRKDVIRMKVPYPSVDSKLAYSAHMYICMDSNSPHFKFVKSQTLKPYMLSSTQFVDYVDELPDLNRNPFSHETRIDCDKLFTSDGVEYDETLKTTARPDVCEDLFNDIMAKLQKRRYTTIRIDEYNLKKLNPKIQ